MSKSYCVYKHTAPNGKVYIGITSQDPKQRFKNGSGYWHNEHFLRAIRLYGWENIQHDIVQIKLTREQAIAEEKRLITLHDSTNIGNGYNMMTGGDSLGTHTPETIEKLRLLSLGKTWTDERKEHQRQKMLGHKLSEASRQKLSESKRGPNNYMYGKHLSEEHRLKIKKNSPSRKGGKSNLAIRVCKYDLQGNFICEYPAISTAAEENNIQSTYGISCVARGRQKTAYGYIWRYAEGVAN